MAKKEKYTRYKTSGRKETNKITKLTRHLTKEFAFKNDFGIRDSKLKTKQHFLDGCAYAAAKRLGTHKFPNHLQHLIVVMS
jgi:hypothetical protein